MARGTRGITFNVNKPDEKLAYDFSYEVNLSDCTRKALLMLHRIKKEKPELYSFLQELDWAEFAVKYLPSEKQRIDLRNKAMTTPINTTPHATTQLDSTINQRTK